MKNPSAERIPNGASAGDASAPARARARGSIQWTQLARRIGIPVFFTVLLGLACLTIPKYALANDVESGWGSVLTYARQHGLQFGPQIAYPYGPLGFLLVPQYTMATGYSRLFFDLLFCLTAAAGTCLLAWRFQLGWRALILVAFVAATVSKAAGVQDLLIDLVLLTWGLLSLTENGPRASLYVAVLVAAAVVAALAKVTSLISALFTVGVVGFDLALRGRWRSGLATWAGFAAGFIGLWALNGQSLGNLPVFLERTFMLCAGYEQAMALPPNNVPFAAALAILLVAVVQVWFCCLVPFRTGERARTVRQCVISSWLLGMLFLGWKHGLVRADQHHLALFIGFVAVFALLVAAVPQAQGRLRLAHCALGGLTCMVSVVLLQTSLSSRPTQLGDFVRRTGENAKSLLHPAAYCAQMKLSLDQEIGNLRLPGSQHVIGSAPMDLFGNFQSYAILNGLDYLPRPVFQSYAAYSASLMRVNDNFYHSERAPQFVLATLEPIDDRFPPLEDALVLRDLLVDFRLRGTEGGFLVLERKSTEVPHLRLVAQGALGPGEKLDLQSYGDTNLWLEIVAPAALPGRVRQFAYQLAPLRLEVALAASEQTNMVFRAPGVMMAAGFVASPLLTNDRDLLNLYSGKPVRRPVSYCVEIEPNQKVFWKAQFQFRLYRIESQLGFIAPAQRQGF